MKKIVKIELTEAEAAWVAGMRYGMYTPAGDRRVGRTIVRALKLGVVDTGRGDFNDFCEDVVYAVAVAAMGDTEASDTAVQETIAYVVKRIMANQVPVPAGN
jgi:hypothetical protein